MRRKSKRSNLNGQPDGEDLFQLKARADVGNEHAFDDFWIFGQLDVIVVNQRRRNGRGEPRVDLQQQDVVGIHVNVLRIVKEIRKQVAPRS